VAAALLATVPAGVDPGELALALSQPAPTEILGAAERSVAEAESVTGQVERALELFTACAQGRIDRSVALKEADALIGTLERLDREGRYADAFRLARALAGLLALLMRWMSLVQSLRIALKAAAAAASDRRCLIFASPFRVFVDVPGKCITFGPRRQRYRLSDWFQLSRRISPRTPQLGRRHPPLECIALTLKRHAPRMRRHSCSGSPG